LYDINVLFYITVMSSGVNRMSFRRCSILLLCRCRRFAIEGILSSGCTCVSVHMCYHILRASGHRLLVGISSNLHQRGQSTILRSKVKASPKTALCHFEGHGFKGQERRQPFWRRNISRWLAVKDHLVY